MMTWIILYYTLLLILSGVLPYQLGKHLAEGEAAKEIAHLKHELSCVQGLWATDQPDLIKYHAKKERFFRIGYPEHKL